MVDALLEETPFDPALEVVQQEQRQAMDELTADVMGDGESYRAIHIRETATPEELESYLALDHDQGPVVEHTHDQDPAMYVADPFVPIEGDEVEVVSDFIEDEHIPMPDFIEDEDEDEVPTSTGEPESVVNPINPLNEDEDHDTQTTD